MFINPLNTCRSDGSTQVSETQVKSSRRGFSSEALRCTSLTSRPESCNRGENNNLNSFMSLLTQDGNNVTSLSEAGNTSSLCRAYSFSLKTWAWSQRDVRPVEKRNSSWCHVLRPGPRRNPDATWKWDSPLPVPPNTTSSQAFSHSFTDKHSLSTVTHAGRLGQQRRASRNWEELQGISQSAPRGNLNHSDTPATNHTCR